MHRNTKLLASIRHTKFAVQSKFQDNEWQNAGIKVSIRDAIARTPINNRLIDLNEISINQLNQKIYNNNQVTKLRMKYKKEQMIVSSTRLQSWYRMIRTRLQYRKMKERVIKKVVRLQKFYKYRICRKRIFGLVKTWKYNSARTIQ